MATISELEQQLQAQDDNLKEIEEILAVMPDEQEALEMKAQVLSTRREIEEKISSLKSKDVADLLAETSPPPPPPTTTTIAPSESSDIPPPPNPTSSTSTSTLPNPSKPAEDSRPIIVFKTNETVSAKYKADKQWYPAVINSVMGSSSAPIYTVKYKGYNETVTLKHYEVRPLHPPNHTPGNINNNNQKRKIDDLSPLSTDISSSSTSIQTPLSASTASYTPTGGSISAPAVIDSNLADAARAAAAALSSGLAAGGTNGNKPLAKKVKTNKALDKAKGNWQDWQKKATGKVAKVVGKESMFRTGESSTAKVGFTGSGHAMRKDAGRIRHKFTRDGNE